MRNRANRVFPLALLALAVLPYFGSFWNGFTIDDFFTYADNMFVRDWRHWPDLFDHAYFVGSNEASYRPLCTATYFTDWSLWRQWPGGPHVTNVALYAATVLALFALFRRLTASPLAAFCGSALFALHPLHTEVVNSLSFREDLLVSLFVTPWLRQSRWELP